MSKLRSGQYLAPLDPIKRPRKFAVVDIESNDWIKFEFGGIFDGERYEKFDSIDDLARALVSTRFEGHTFFAHNGGRFDFLFLLPALKRTALAIRLIPIGSRVAGISLRNDRRKWKLYDSFCLMPRSLKDLSAIYGVAHGKMCGAIDFESERVSRKNPDHVRYNEYDCRALYECIEAYYAGILSDSPLKLTLASTGLDVYRRHFMPRPIARSPDRVQEFVRNSYVGGRCEIFRTHGFDLNTYDVNSLFPHCMRNYPIPENYIALTKNADDFGFHDVTVEIPEMHLPVLHTHHEGKLLFPTGTFRGTYFSEELKLAVTQGAKILKHHEGMKFSKSQDLFQKYVDYFYDQRLKNPGNNALNYQAKLFLNTLYGKWGEREETSEIVTLDEWRENPNRKAALELGTTGLVIQTKYRRTNSMLVHISSAITAWSRIHMYAYYKALGENLYYTDTDSLYTTETLPAQDGLGHLKFEGKWDRAFFLVPKGYYLEKDGKAYKKLKGFPQKFVNSLSKEEFLAGKFRYTENKMLTLKTSIIRNQEYLSMGEIKKSRLSGYTKRKILRDGTTEPWVLKNGKVQNETR